MPGTPRPRRRLVPDGETDSQNPNTARLLRALPGVVKSRRRGRCGYAKAVKKHRNSPRDVPFAALHRVTTTIRIDRKVVPGFSWHWSGNGRTRILSDFKGLDGA